MNDTFDLKYVQNHQKSMISGEVRARFNRRGVPISFGGEEETTKINRRGGTSIRTLRVIEWLQN